MTSSSHTSHTAFVYSWTIDDDGCIHGFGLDMDNKSVHLEVTNFTPYMYMELPENIVWSQSSKQGLITHINELPVECQPLNKSFTMKKKLYFANGKDMNGEFQYNMYPYLFLNFKSRDALTFFMKKMSYGVYIAALNQKIRFKFHEHTASTPLQFCCCRGISATGWVTFNGVVPRIPTSSCNSEYTVKWNNVNACTDEVTLKKVPCPTILVFDCEANSDNINTMPKNRPNDKIFQISFAVTKHSSGVITTHLLSLGQPDSKSVGEETTLHLYKTEGDLLIGFSELIREIDPQIISGYNILGWDFEYLIKRAKLVGVFREFSSFGYLLGIQGKEREISWSSSAFNAQNFTFIDAPGRVLIDMINIVKRDFKFSSYALGSVATEILGQTKDPLTHKGIFKCYRIFSPASLSLVGKYCFVPGTRVSMGSCSIPIEQLANVTGNVLSWNESKSGFQYSSLDKHFDNGLHECVELTFSDGTSITCTDDHKFLSTDGWVEAKNITQNMRMWFGPEQAHCDYLTEKDETFMFSESIGQMSYNHARIFARLLGYLLTDGSINETHATIHFGTKFDAEQAGADIMTLVGKMNSIQRQLYTYSIHLPAQLRKMFTSVNGVELGKRLDRSCGLPEFVSDENTPMWVLREFLKGLMGGDGWSCGLAKSDDKLTYLGFSQSKTSEHLESLYMSMEVLRTAFDKFGIKSTTRNAKKNKSGDGYTIELAFTSDSIIPFYENIGYAYCYSKSYRTAVTVSYLRLRNKVHEQFKYVCSRTRELMATGQTSENAREVACNEIEDNYPVYAKASLPSTSVARKDRSSYKGEFKTTPGTFPKFSEYLKQVGAYQYFTSESSSKSHVLGQEADVAPGFTLSLLKRTFVGPKQTYDIEVKDTHTFVANGAVVHNCVKDSLVTLLLFDKLKAWIGSCQMSATMGVSILDLYVQGQQLKIFSQVYKDCIKKNIVVEHDAYQCADDESYTGAIVLEPEPGMYKDVVTFDFASLYPSVMISNNICYSTLVVDQNIPDEKCHVLAWRDCIGCEHDTVKRLTKPKKIICAERKYRFLKSPVGILPNLLKNLISERKKAKREMEQTEKEASEEKDPEKKKALLMYASVCDMRQLSLKVSSNSIYGGMGVRKGKLPFMPGAMSTTAGGREALMKAKRLVMEKYPGKDVYGDSVTEDTPLLIRYKNKIMYRTIDNLPEVTFDMDGDKEIDKSPAFEVWSDKGFTKVKRVIRHKTDKKLYKILTHTGLVTVTEDHSLLDPNGSMVTPKEIKVGTKLLHHPLPTTKGTAHVENAYDIGAYIHQYDEIPDEMFNATDKSVQNFVEGFRDSCGECPNDLVKAGVFYLFQKSGVKVQLNEFGEIVNGKGSNKIQSITPLPPSTQYVYDLETENHHFSAGVGEMVVHNTDSLMYIFDGMERFRDAEGKTDYKLLEEFACTVAEDISKEYPAPMKLEYENIAQDFLIFTKKRYMTRLSTGKFKKRGIMITRRDNSPCCRSIYEGMLKCMFEYQPQVYTELYLIESLNKIYSHYYPTSDYTISKSIKEIDDYVVKPLSDDPTKRATQLAGKFLSAEASELDYSLRSLPGHVQLAEKMRRRGMFVEAGSRIEYVVTDVGGIKGKIWQKLESSEYYKAHSEMIRLDMNYYCKSLMNPVDQAMETMYKLQDFMKDQLYLRTCKQSYIDELKKMFSVNIVFQ